MADEPDWAKLLTHLYSTTSGAERQQVDVDDEWDASTKETKQLTALDERLCDVAGLESDPGEVNEILTKLQEWGLVKVMSSESEAVVALEADGFEVAHERESGKRQDRTNSVLVILTAGLVYAALVQTQISFYQLSEPLQILTFILVEY